jgi:CDGSH-type Zn-finger protein
MALPRVFDVRRRPWVDVHAADADVIADAVGLCPTGALRYARLDGEPGEQPRRPTLVVPVEHGPLLVLGDLHVRTPEGATIAREYRLTLCRCGRSQNQPFCDNSHLASGFRSASFARRPPAHPRDRVPADVGESPTTITPELDGPLEVDGHVVVATQRGELLAESDRLVFCRCGRSASKPFCDSSHEGRFETRAPELRAERRRAETPAAFEPNPQVRPGAAAER